MYTVKDVLIFDVETTGLPEKGHKYDTHYMYFPNIVSLAWSIGGVDNHFIIKPDGYEIPEEATKIHGITTEIAMKEGWGIDNVLDKFYNDALNAKLICAHNIYFDTSIIKASTLKYMGKSFYDNVSEPALGKEKRIDTMMKTIKFVGALKANGTPGKFPKLEELYDKLFPGETFDAHDALEDVGALKRCLPELVKLGIIELVIKDYSEQTKVDFKKTSSKPIIKDSIIFDDPNPIVIPDTTQMDDFISGIKEFGQTIQQAKDALQYKNPLLGENDF